MIEHRVGDLLQAGSLGAEIDSRDIFADRREDVLDEKRADAGEVIQGAGQIRNSGRAGRLVFDRPAGGWDPDRRRARAGPRYHMDVVRGVALGFFMASA